MGWARQKLIPQVKLSVEKRSSENGMANSAVQKSSPFITRASQRESQVRVTESYVEGGIVEKYHCLRLQFGPHTTIGLRSKKVCGLLGAVLILLCQVAVDQNLFFDAQRVHHPLFDGGRARRQWGRSRNHSSRWAIRQEPAICPLPSFSKDGVNDILNGISGVRVREII